MPVLAPVLWPLLLLAAPPDVPHYAAPAGTRPASRAPGAESVLPGGRFLTPTGRQFQTGPGPFGIAVNSTADIIVTSDGGPDSMGLSIVENAKPRWRTRRLQARKKRGNTVATPPRKEAGDPDGDEEWFSSFLGLAFDGRHTLYAAEGNSGRVRRIDVRSGARHQIFELDQAGARDSYSCDIAYDPDREVLFVLDQANFRMAAFDTKKNRLLGSVKLGRLPFALALSPDRSRAYITQLGLFQYRAIPGADKKRARETGISFPAFGFPSPEAVSGARRDTAQGPVDVPGLGEPNVPEAMSLAVVDIADPAAMKVVKFVPTGLPVGDNAKGGSSPSGVIATSEYIFVSNAHNDTVSVIDARSLERAPDIALRVPGLESLRGIMPLGLAIHNDWLLVAEAGINALGVVDIRSRRVLGHIPTGWFPARVIADQGMVYVSNAKGHGTGPNADRVTRKATGELRHGSVSIFPVPSAEDLASMTRRVWRNNGFLPASEPPAPLPPELKYVVIIVKENRTFDEVLGDMTAANGPVSGDPELARFGERAPAPSDRGLTQRFSLRSVNVTPNHHEIARKYAFSDNFYVDAEVSVDGHHWIVGSYPNAWTESSLMASYGGQKDFRFPTTAPGRLSYPQSNSSVHPEEYHEAGTIWHHFDRHGVTFRNFGEGFELAGVDEGPGLTPTGARYLTNVPMPNPLYRNTSRAYPQYNMNIPDQYRAAAFIREIEELYRKPGNDLPRVLFLHLPNDHTADPRPADGYPFRASYVADNDLALGRILEYLSNSPWWKQMAVFITEDDAQGGVDHVDSHRTVLLVASPYARKNFVSKVHSSFPGMLKTVFRILGLPPLNLYDASASDLAGCFTSTPDFTPYKALPIHRELFDPATAKEPAAPQPSPRMDDPEETRKQRRQQ